MCLAKRHHLIHFQTNHLASPLHKTRLPRNLMPHILFYVTSHGLGHATRALSIISKLLQEERGQTDFTAQSQQESSDLSSTGISITLVTGKGTRIPHSLLPVASGSNTLAFRESALIDPGVLQSSPTTINTEGTWDLQQEFIASLSDRIQEEVSFLTSPFLDNVSDASSSSSSKSKSSRKRFDLAIMDATPFPAIACHVRALILYILLTLLLLLMINLLYLHIYRKPTYQLFS